MKTECFFSKRIKLELKNYRFTLRFHKIWIHLIHERSKQQRDIGEIVKNRNERSERIQMSQDCTE